MYCAEKVFKKYTQIYPLHIKAKLKLIYIYKKMRNIFGMNTEYKKILEIDPTYITTEYIISNFDIIIENIKITYFNIFNSNIKLESYEDILHIETKYCKTLKNNPNNIKIQFALSNYLYLFEYINNSIDIYKKIILIDKDNLEARYFLLKIYVKHNKYTEIEQICLDIIQINPKYINAYYYLAIVYHNREDIINAKLLCDKVLELNPSHTNVNFIIASIYLKMNNINDAKLYLNKIIEVNPLSIKTYFEQEYATPKQPIKHASIIKISIFLPPLKSLIFFRADINF